MNHDDSHVVLARLTSCKILDRAEHGKQRCGSGRTTTHLHGCQQPFDAEVETLGVTTFDDPIGITEQRIAGPQRNLPVGKSSTGHDSQKRTAFLQALHLSLSA